MPAQSSLPCDTAVQDEEQLTECSLVVEGFPTSLNWAGILFLSGMYRYVVIELLPGNESHLAFRAGKWFDFMFCSVRYSRIFGIWSNPLTSSVSLHMSIKVVFGLVRLAATFPRTHVRL